MLSVHLATVPVSRMPSSGSSTTGTSEAASSGTASVLQNTATTTIVPPHLYQYLLQSLLLLSLTVDCTYPSKKVAVIIRSV